MEGARIIKILHDDVGQILSSVGLQLELLRMDFEDRAPQIGARTVEIQQLLERAMAQLRQLIGELNSAAVKPGGAEKQ